MGTMSRGVVLAAMILAFCAPRAAAQWTQCAGPEGGYVNGIVDEGTAFIAATAQRVYRYDKATERWQALGARFPGVWLQAVTVYDGMLLAGVTNGEIHRSSDGGTTWTLTGTGWGSIFQFATTPSAVYAAAGSKLVVKSTDGGATWSETGAGLEGGSVEAIVAGDGRIFASTNAGIFRSDDEGGSWTKVADVGRMNSFFVDGGTIWAGGYQQAFRSTDAGATWTMMAGSAVFAHRVLCFARTATYLYAGALDGGIARTSDDGVTWEKVNAGLPALRILALVTDGAAVYACTSGGGMYVLTEPGNSWTPRNDGLYALPVRGLLSMGTKVFSATSGRGIMMADAADLDTWVAQNEGLPAPNFYSLARAGETLLAGSDDFGMYRSSDGGASWVPPANGLLSGDIYALLVQGQEVFAGTNGKGIHHSSDAGDTWTQRGDSISGEAVWGLTALGPKLFAGMHRKGVLMSSDGGVNWATAGEELAGRRIVAVHAHGSNLFASVNNVATYRSTDEGLTWTSLGGPMERLISQCFLSIGTQIFTGILGGGLYGSTDGGETWVTITDELPSETIFALAVQDDVLLAGLEYSGVWKRPLSEVILGVGDAAPSPRAFRLHPVAPQPLRDRGTARFDLETGAEVRLELFDLLGRQVATVADAGYGAGSHAVAFDAAGLRTGTYLLRLRAGDAQASQRVTVIR